MSHPQQPATWLVIPVFNRRDITMGCLDHLNEVGVLGWAQVVVADGGSTDGTVQGVREKYPNVTVLEGKWWWMEGIRAGMEYAQAQQAEMYVWLNDDCRPEPGSVEELVRQAVTSGQVCGGITQSGGGAYTGMYKTPWGLKPVEAPLETHKVISVDTLVGNFVAIPAKGVALAGLPDAVRFPHLSGDHYYTSEVARFTGGHCNLVCGARALDVHPAVGWDRESILRGSQPVSYIASQLTRWEPRRGILPELRLHLHLWGPWGIVLVGVPWLKKWLLLGLRIALPEQLRKKL